MEIDELNKWGRKFYNRIIRLIGRSSISSVKVGEPNKTLFTAKVKGAGGTVSEGTEIFNDYGFISFPPDGSEAIIVYPRGDKGNKGVIIKTVNRKFLPTSLNPGDSAMFDNRGQLLIMSNDGISITDSANNHIVMNKFGINLNGVIIDNKGSASFPATIDAKDVISSKKDVVADKISLVSHITEVPGEGLLAGNIKVSGVATSLQPKK